MNTLKSLVVLCLLLSVTTLCARPFSQLQKAGIPISTEKYQGSADGLLMSLHNNSGSIYSGKFSTVIPTNQSEKLLLTLEEDEENEHHNTAKKTIIRSAHDKYSVQCWCACDLAVVQHIPHDEHLNNEKVYLLYLVFRI